MSYIPDFSRNAKGKYNPKLAFVSVKGGTDAYLLEDELNELQFIQSEALAELIRKTTNSGVLTIDTANKEVDGAFKAHNYYIEDSSGQVLQEADIISSSDELNKFTINPFNAVLDGHIARIESNKNGLVVNLTGPYAIGTNRVDFVYLEFWYSEVKNTNSVYEYGGVENNKVQFEMMDSRLSGVQTTNRVQLQWRIKVLSDGHGDETQLGPHYNNGNTPIEELHINPQGPNVNEFTNYTFRTAEHDKHLFIAGSGDSTKNVFGTVDGYIYAIPIFEVSRLNQSGYSIMNPSGGITWDENSSAYPSDRITLDKKWANVIYTNDVTECRHQASLGPNELDKLYIRTEDFNKFNKETITNMQENIENNATNIVNLQTQTDHEIQDLKDQIDFLTIMSL